MPDTADHCMAALPWGVVIIDESHNLRTTNSRQADSPQTGQHTKAELHRAASSRPIRESETDAAPLVPPIAGTTPAVAPHPAVTPCTHMHVLCPAEAAVAAAGAAPRVILLSGTPSLSRPYDLFRQVDVLQPGILGRAKEDFAHRCGGTYMCRRGGESSLAASGCASSCKSASGVHTRRAAAASGGANR